MGQSIDLSILMSFATYVMSLPINANYDKRNSAMNLIWSISFIISISIFSHNIVHDLSTTMFKAKSVWQRYEYLHYCGRLLALRLNIKATKDYLASLKINRDQAALVDDLIEKRFNYWITHSAIDEQQCELEKPLIRLYMQHNDELPKIYPNWTYAIQAELTEISIR